MSSGGVRAGRAYVKITMLDKTQKVLNGASARLRGFSRSVGAMGAGLLAGAGALAAPFIPAIAKASDMQEIMGKFNTVFADQAGDVKGWSDTFAGEVGRSEKQIAGFMANSQDLFVPLGFDRGAAAELSKTVTALGVDLASFGNKSDDDAIRDLHAALTGSGEVMKKYGVNLEAAAVEQELFNRGLDPKNATNQQKVQARLNIILRDTSDAQGDAIRTSGSYANQMKRLHGVVDNTQVAIGTALLPVLTMLVSKASSVVTMLGAWITANPRIVQGIAAVAAGAAIAGGVLLVVAGAASVAGTILGTMATVAGIVGAGFALLLSPIGLVVAGIVGLIAAGIAWTGAWSTIVDFFNGTLGAMGNALANGDLALAGSILWSSLKLAFAQGTLGIRQAWIETWAGMASILDGFITSIRQRWIDLTTGLASVLIKLWNKVQPLFGKSTIDVQATIATLREDQERKQKANEDGRKSRDDARGAQLQADLAATQSELDALKAARQSRVDDAGGETFTGSGSLLDQLKGFLSQATETPTAAAKDATEPPKKPSDGVEAASKVAGTFSSSAAGRMGGTVQKADERIVKAAEKTNSKLDKLVKIVERGGTLSWA